MKNKIIINISKDTPAEILTALQTALKTKDEKPKRKQPLYALNEDIEKLHARYEELYKQVKTSQNLSEKQIENECETLSRKYDFELEELSKWRKLEYDKQQAAIKARADEQTPWRRSWWWRLLLFFPLTNRAQDIIEARAELDADIKHTADEKAIENDRKKLPTNDSDIKQSKRKLKRKMRDKLKAIIKAADNADVQEAFDEPTQNETPESATSEPKATPAPQGNGQLPGQITLDDVQQMPTMPARRPRPPRSCRRA